MILVAAVPAGLFRFNDPCAIEWLSAGAVASELAEEAAASGNFKTKRRRKKKNAVGRLVAPNYITCNSSTAPASIYIVPYIYIVTV
jgi:hypothetical protein